MKSLGLKIIGILIIGIFLMQSSFVFAVSSEETQLRNQQSENNKKINEAESELKEVQAEKSATLAQVEEIATQISNYEAEIEELDGQISELNTKISESKKQLEKAQEDYTNQEELLEARLVATYEAGETSYLDVLLSSESITDFISNYYLVTEVASYDAELLEKIEKQKQEIEEAKKVLEESQQKLTTSKANKQSISSQLQVAKKQKDEQVAKLSEQEKEIHEHIDGLRAASRQIEKEIKAAQERYAAQIAALNNKNNGSSNSSSSGGSYNSGGSGVLQKPVKTGSVTATMYYSNGSYHGALDYGVPVGTPIYAAATGVVIKTANLTYSYGTYVVIQHANGLQTWYAHGTSGSICVSPGQTVSRGQQIMLSGDTGNSTGPHLHFEVRVSPYDYNTCRVDPRNYF